MTGWRQPVAGGTDAITKLREQVHTVQLSLAGLTATLALLAALGVYRWWNENIIDAERQRIVALLVDRFSEDVGALIDRLMISGDSEPRDTHLLLEKAKRGQAELQALNPEDQRFASFARMVDAIDAHLKNDADSAHKIVAELVEESFVDASVSPRALTLKAFFDVLPNPSKYQPLVEDSLRKVISSDGSVALAYNILGIQESTKALTTLAEGDPDTAVEQMQSALIDFEINLRLAPSTIALYKFLNNTVWAKTAMVQASLHGQLDEQQLRRMLGEGVVEFFDGAQNTIARYRAIDPTLPASFSTEGELLSVYAEYLTKTKQESAAKEAARRGRIAYRKAVEHHQFRPQRDGVKDFRENDLIAFLRSDEQWAAAVAAEIRAQELDRPPAH